MKFKILFFLLLLILCFLITSKILFAKTETIQTQGFCIEPSYVPLPPPPKPDSLDIYLDKLAMCESGNNPNAINPVDRDGTASLGRYQFKVTSFNYFSQMYGIATTSIWSGSEQRTIVRKMAQTLNKTQWVHQFPDCTLNYVGYPPNML